MFFSILRQLLQIFILRLVIIRIFYQNGLFLDRLPELKTLLPRTLNAFLLLMIAVFKRNDGILLQLFFHSLLAFGRSITVIVFNDCLNELQVSSIFDSERQRVKINEELRPVFIYTLRDINLHFKEVALVSEHILAFHAVNLVR